MLMGCRLLQGMSVGGQLPASLIYTVETKPKSRWGFYGSLVMVSAVFSSMLMEQILNAGITIIIHWI